MHKKHRYYLLASVLLLTSAMLSSMTYATDYEPTTIMAPAEALRVAKNLLKVKNSKKTGAWSHRVQDLCIGKSFGLAFEEGTMATPEQFKIIASLLLQFGYVREGANFKDIFNARENNPRNYKGKEFNEHLTVCQILATAGAQIKSSGNTYFTAKGKEIEFINKVQTSLSSGIKGVKEETVETVLKSIKKLLGKDAHALFIDLPELTKEEKAIEALKLPEQNDVIDIPNFKQNLFDYAYDYNQHKGAIEEAKKAQSAGGWDTDVKDLNLKGVLGEWDNLEAGAEILKTYPGTALELYRKINEAYLKEREGMNVLLSIDDRRDAEGKLKNVMARFMKPVPVEKPEPVVEEEKPEPKKEKPKPPPRPKTLKELGEENHIFESVEPTKEKFGKGIVAAPDNEVYFEATQWEISKARTDDAIKAREEKQTEKITGILLKDAVEVFKKTVGEFKGKTLNNLIKVTVKHKTDFSKTSNVELYFLLHNKQILLVYSSKLLPVEDNYPTIEEIKEELRKKLIK